MKSSFQTKNTINLKNIFSILTKTLLFPQHYMQLNEPYMLHNNEYFSKRDIDLNILRPPEMLAPKAPIYVNGNIIPQISKKTIE